MVSRLLEDKKKSLDFGLESESLGLDLGLKSESLDLGLGLGIKVSCFYKTFLAVS